MIEIKEILKLENIYPSEIIKIADEGNSKVYLLEMPETKKILKLYPDEDKKRDRMNKEIIGIRAGRCLSLKTPEIYLTSKENNLIIMEYIQGKKEITLKDWQIGKIAKGIKELRQKRGQTKIGYAKDACITIEQHYKNTKRRLEIWSALITKEKDKYTQSLREWIKELEIKMEHEWVNTISKMSNEQLTETDERLIIFSQSDVGKHNLLIKENEIYTIDMEYSGLDDISKNLIDWYLQPDHGMSKREMEKYIKELKLNNLWVEEIGARINLVSEIHRIKWCLIILNKYIDGQDSRLIEKSKKYYDNTKQKIKELNQLGS